MNLEHVHDFSMCSLSTWNLDAIGSCTRSEVNQLLELRVFNDAYWLIRITIK